jgi:hypothetical protein
LRANVVPCRDFANKAGCLALFLDPEVKETSAPSAVPTPYFDFDPVRDVYGAFFTAGGFHLPVSASDFGL